MSYEYDGNGNRISKTENKAGESKQLETTRYDYDTLNQLTGIRHPEGRQASYGYDPLGRMIQSQRPHLPGTRPVKAEGSRFTYSGQDILDEWWGDGTPRAEYYHGNGETVAKRLFDGNGHFEPGGVISPHENYLYLNHDALGSVSGMTDRQGTQVMRYRQDAFGAPTAGTLEPYNQQLLTEKGFDTTSGLYYFGSRWYDPGSGRFMNQDSYRGSASEPMSQHRYAYVHNNPANLVDEWGYNAQWKPQPHNVALDGLVTNLQGGGSMFMNFNQQLSGRVGARIGGMATGAYNGVVGAAQWVGANPWQAAGITALAAVAVVGVVLTAPISMPAILAALPTATTFATNYAIGQGFGLAMGIARDASELINPTLGTAMGYAQTGFQVFQAVTSLMDGLGTLASVDPGQVGSLFSTEGASVMSSVLGNSATLARTAGVEVPGLSEVSDVLSYAAMGAALTGNQSAIARRVSPEPINFEATGSQVAPLAAGRSQAEVESWMAAARSSNAAISQTLGAPIQIAMAGEMGPNSTYNPGASSSDFMYDVGYNHPGETMAAIEAGKQAVILVVGRGKKFNGKTNKAKPGNPGPSPNPGQEPKATGNKKVPTEGPPPPNVSPPGAGRTGAFNEAKSPSGNNNYA